MCTTESANAQSDQMLRDAAELSYGSGVAWFDFEAERRLEFGYLLVPEVATKLGFTFWKQATVDGYLDDLYRRAFS